MEANSALIEILNRKKPWLHNNNSIWLASSISLERNFDKFIFPNKLDVERKQQIVNLVGKELLNNKHLLNPRLFKADELSLFDKDYLVEHFFTISNFHQTGAGEAFLIDDSGEIIVTFNLTDHLSFYKLDFEKDLEGSWQKLMKIESTLGRSLSYAYSQKFGFLTANFDQCGTALKVTTYLHLPALTHLEKIDDILEKEIDENILVMGMQGSPTELIGDIFAIQNNYTLGLTEETIISTVRSLTTKLIEEEKNARKSIKDSQNVEIIDRVSRAFGILTYSYQMEAIEEALNAISLIKLGLEMGWIGGITEGELNELFFNCRRAHLLDLLPRDLKITQEEIPHTRAEFIHKALKKVQLLV